MAPNSVYSVCSVSVLRGRLGQAEVDDLRHGDVVQQRDENVRRLEIAMDDALLVRVLNAVADLEEQVDALTSRQAISDRSKS